MNIREATTHDSESLTDLTIRSKGYWGYSQQQLDEWKDDLKVSEDYLKEHKAYLVQVDNQVIGYYAFQKLSDRVVKLDNLFIDPNQLGSGLGTRLLKDFLDRAKALGFEQVTLDADPHAERFYLKMGFKVVGKLESSIPNRFLPVMKLNISNK